ncbi:unnamed protein product [Candida verbasci]|uniref:WDR11 first beta-propeller domain-containing protein n=1 Tax=Candida verbasci TaxID=1227364 RepID=A0A9W4TUR7_9ASCO|nr:unnamed protein product [Candida verbasci]
MDFHRCRFVDYTPHTITSLAFSHPSSHNITPDLRLAVGRSNGDIEIWNPKFNWTHELTIYGSKNKSIEGLCWQTSNDEAPRLFSIGGSTYITEWDLVTGKPIINYDCNAGIIWCIDINSSQNKLCVGCDDGSVVLIDISGGKGSLEYDIICQRQDSRILSIKWNNLNDNIIGGCADGRIRAWDTVGGDSNINRGRILNTMKVDKSKHESTLVWSLNILQKRQQLISGDSTGSVKIWDLHHHQLIQTFKIHDADVLSIVSDLNEEKFFTGGVDRKIHQFDLLTNKETKSSKWSHSSNRLLHSNDIRSMTIFQNKRINFLVSGGVERSIIIQDALKFHDGNYKKLLINQQISNTKVIPNKKLIIFWQDQTIKIWRISKNKEETKHKLVSKIVLSDDENIIDVDFNEQQNLLAVSKINSIKLFKLEENGSKFKVIKFRDEAFESILDGGKKVKFYNDNKLLILTPDDEIYKFQINVEEMKIQLIGDIELLSTKISPTQYTYYSSINNLVISPNQENLIISKFNGSIEVYNIQNGESYSLTTLSTFPHLIKCFNDEKLILLTEENKIHEFFIQPNENGLLTPWSKRNSEFLPRLFTQLDDKPQDMFIQNDLLWIYGSKWLCYFDLSMNIPINKIYKNTSSGKKRNNNGLTIDESDDDEEDEEAQNLESSLKQSEIDKLRNQIKIKESNSNGLNKKPFWMTDKYRPILKADNFGSNEIIVIERPYFALPKDPAFSIPKLKV